MKFSKSLVVLGMTTIMCSSVVFGAVNHQKVEALLVTNKIVKDNKQVLQDVQLLNYNGSLYVPLRKFGETTGTAINYKDGIVYLGNNNTIPEKTTSTQSKVAPKGYSYLNNGQLIMNKDNVTNYQEYYDASIKKIKSILKDPESAKFNYEINDETYPIGIAVIDGVTCVVGRVRAANSYGGFKVSSYIVAFNSIDDVKFCDIN